MASQLRVFKQHPMPQRFTTARVRGRKDALRSEMFIVTQNEIHFWMGAYCTRLHFQFVGEHQIIVVEKSDQSALGQPDTPVYRLGRTTCILREGLDPHRDAAPRRDLPRESNSSVA